MDYKDKSNNELLTMLNDVKIEHSAIKDRMLKDYDRMLAIEHNYQKLNEELTSRAKG